MMQQPFEPLQSLSLFPLYMTREGYKQAVSEEAPAWNPGKRPKHWFDPAPVTAFLGPGGEGYALYSRVIFEPYKHSPSRPAEPVVEQLVILTEEAGQVNIPPTGIGQTNVPGADRPAMPYPLRPLGPSQALVFRFGATVAVRNLDVAVPGEGGGFTDGDRALLQRVADKLGA